MIKFSPIEHITQVSRYFILWWGWKLNHSVPPNSSRESMARLRRRNLQQPNGISSKI